MRYEANQLPPCAESLKGYLTSYMLKIKEILITEVGKVLFSFPRNGIR